MNHTAQTLHPSRNSTLDLIKAVAIAGVIMIHASASYVTDSPTGSASFLMGNIMDSISRFGAPFFVMVSGALLLDENRVLSSRKVLTRRIPQTLGLLLFWSALYALLYKVCFPLYRGETVRLKALVTGFLYGHTHLWYLYMLVGLYLVLPFLRSFVCKKNQKWILLYLAVTLLAQFTAQPLQILSKYWIPAAYLPPLIRQFKLGFFHEYIAYFLAGWYITHVGIPKRLYRLLIYGAALMSLLATIFYVQRTRDYDNAYASENLFIFLYIVGVYLALSQVRLPAWLEKPAYILSKYSFGTYLLHPVFLYIINRTLPLSWLPPVGLMVRWGLPFAVAFLLTYFLSKIPFLKKLVRA